MPLLADVYGLYYNKDLLQQAGISGPPKTISELDDYAKRLTQRNGDSSTWSGSSQHRVLRERRRPLCATLGCPMVRPDGKAALASDPAWADLLDWDKNLIDSYGYDNLTRWQAGAGEEFSASNAFETGKIAMILDGEYRTAFIKAEHPELNYGTAPLPGPRRPAGPLRRRLCHRQHHGHPEGKRQRGGGLGAGQVPDHRHTGALVELANGLRQRADDCRVGEVRRRCTWGRSSRPSSTYSRTRTARPTR